jgi:iron complex outermembrane receptor protein
MKFNHFLLGILFMIIGPAVMNAQTIKGLMDENGQVFLYANVVDKVTSS